MEKEISSGTMLGIVLLALASTIGLGFGVFEIAKGVALGNGETVGFQLSVINSTLLSITAMTSWLSFFISRRLSKIHNYFYSNRFRISNDLSTNIEVKYIENKKIHLGQVFTLLFRPVRYKKVEEISIDNSVDLELEGILQKEGKKLLIDDYYLSLDTDLFEYLDRDIKLIVKVAGTRQKIERFLSSYEVVSVNQRTA